MHSYYSLRYGTLAPEEIPKLAKAHGAGTVVLTDINNTSCAYSFVKACREEGVKPVLGIEFRQDGEFLYLGIAKNDEGWRELCATLTESSLLGEPLPKVAPAWKNAFTVYRKLPKKTEHLREDEYIGVRPEEINHLFTSHLRSYPEKLVVFSPVTFVDGDGFKAHKLLRCIDLNIVIGKLEAADCARSSEIFYTADYFQQAYQACPSILQNTRRILDSCHTDMEASYLHNRRTFTGDKAGDYKLLTELAVKGCQQRYGADHKKAMERTSK